MPLSPAACWGISSLAGIFRSAFETSFEAGERARLRVMSGPTCADLLQPFFAKIVKHAIITNNTLPTRCCWLVTLRRRNQHQHVRSITDGMEGERKRNTQQSWIKKYVKTCLQNNLASENLIHSYKKSTTVTYIITWERPHFGLNHLPRALRRVSALRARFQRTEILLTNTAQTQPPNEYRHRVVLMHVLRLYVRSYRSVRRFGLCDG